MEELVERTSESCSAATLDLPDVVYVARVPTRRIMTIALGVGTRLPAHATSMGRVLLAALPDEELDGFSPSAPLEASPSARSPSRTSSGAPIQSVRDQGWALVDQELEIGLRSIAAPIRGIDGRTIAAINVSAAAPRVPLEQLRGRFLPELLKTAELISTALERQRRPAPAPVAVPALPAS